MLRTRLVLAIVGRLRLAGSAVGLSKGPCWRQNTIVGGSNATRLPGVKAVPQPIVSAVVQVRAEGRGPDLRSQSPPL
jgi:hypothetical protein